MRYVFLCLALALPLAAQAEPDAIGGGPGGGRGAMMQPYDATKEETFQAVVSNINTWEKGRMVLVILSVKVGDKTYAVLAGTQTFLKEKNIAFAKDDQITIKGVSVTSDSAMGPRIRAREITKGKDTLTLLDKDGHPTWFQGGRRRRGRG